MGTARCGELHRVPGEEFKSRGCIEAFRQEATSTAMRVATVLMLLDMSVVVQPTMYGCGH